MNITSIRNDDFYISSGSIEPLQEAWLAHNDISLLAISIMD